MYICLNRIACFCLCDFFSFHILLSIVCVFNFMLQIYGEMGETKPIFVYGYLDNVSSSLCYSSSFSQEKLVKIISPSMKCTRKLPSR